MSFCAAVPLLTPPTPPTHPSHPLIAPLTASTTLRATGTSAKKHEGSELCSILNRAIREDEPNATIHAAVFATAINMLLMEDRSTQPWLQQLFQKSYPCVIGFGGSRMIVISEF